jgi:activator of 2-hydroxyglutaryl-CoA dehydratase
MRYQGTARLDEYIHKGRAERIVEYGAVRDGLVKNEQELAEFKKRYTIPPFDPPVITRGSTVNGYIGIDGGSTSSKLVIIDEHGELLYKDYILSKGNPVVDLREMFGRICRWVADCEFTFNVKGTGVTGYASSILYEAFLLDRAVVETVAHMKSAVAFYGDIEIYLRHRRAGYQSDVHEARPCR